MSDRTADLAQRPSHGAGPLLQRAKLSVAGGFRTRAGMEKALDPEAGCTDFISLGRPICSNPSFCKDMLEGRIKRAPAVDLQLSLQSCKSLPRHSRASGRI